MRRPRAIRFAVTFLLFLVFALIGGAWLLYMTESVRVLWLALPIILMHHLAGNCLRRVLRCPNCDVCLPEFDDVNVFSGRGDPSS
jgi:hypothetical protein